MINEIFSRSDTKHGLSIFTKKEIEKITKLISKKDDKIFIKDIIKDKLRVAKPEEIVRQLMVHRLIDTYGYKKERIDIERVVYFGQRDSGFADISILDEDLKNPYIIVEVKRPKRTDGLSQLKSYCNADGATMGIWTNGNEMIRLLREDPNIYVEIPRIPQSTENLRDVLTERWTLKWLDEHNELKQGKTTLKKIILDLEELVLANAGVDPFDEIFKLIYSKLYDEWRGINDKEYRLEFFVGDRTPKKVKQAITALLDGAKRNWAGIFEPTEKIELRDEHLTICVSFLEKIKLFNSNLRVIDEAFEYLIPQVSKKKEGQFFTPRPVEDMVVRMLNPKITDFIIDPACGSAGFLLHSIMAIAGGKLTGGELPPAAKNFAQNNIYGIDFAKKAVKISKAINLIVGDGKSHIFKDNSLTPKTWSEDTTSGLRSKLIRFVDDSEKDEKNQEDFTFMNFDILLTNPPFAGTIKEREILRQFYLSEKNGKLLSYISRHILFLERSLQMVRPGGRLGIVLPQGLLNNTKTEYVRNFLIEHSKILAVIGLHGNTFKPHTGTKTSVLLLQKYTEDEKIEYDDLKISYETSWETYIEKLNKKFKDTRWDTVINDEEIDLHLKHFIEFTFDASEELDDEESEESPEPRHESLFELKEELKNFKLLYDEKQSEIDDGTGDIQLSKKELRTIKSKINALEKKISLKTVGGQIYLALTGERLTNEFKNFWLSQKVSKKLNYSIFLAVNQKPLKDSHGDYIFRKNLQGEIENDSFGHPAFDHDLDEIADEFEKFAKKNHLDFWD